ncbi:MAG: glycosyltransferase family 2 protein [Oscillospiraceae bacterium]|nr:glycosyltransferase family 2 protein [Oscillospiraceae bacterium]
MPEGKSRKVTVIMPAFNSETYIERSVKSVLSQTHRNLELIVVDDGSTDRTAQILGRLGRDDSRLRVIHTENHGPALARNAALDEVSEDTDYVTFIDADDEYLADALAYAMESAESGAELILTGFVIVEADGREREYNEFDCLVRPEDMRTAFPRLYKANLLNQVWAKFYSARRLKESGIRFKDYLWGEDRLFVFDFLEQCPLIAVRSECKYRYIMHAGESLISKFYPKKFQVCIEADIRAQELCERFGVSDDADLRYMFAKSVFSCITTLFSPGCSLGEEGKLLYIREISSNPRVQKRCRDTSGGLPANTLCRILRKGHPRTILSTFRAVALVGDRAPDLFMKLKHRK